jgi:hypothetical protein
LSPVTQRELIATIFLVITENLGMTFAKKGHAESPKFTGMEVNQHFGKTLATHCHLITSFARKP